MDEKIKLLESELGINRVQKDIDVSQYLESGRGAKVSALYIATTTSELTRVIQLCRELKINFLLIGSGSKVWLSLNGFNGLVIKNRSDNLKISGVKGKISKAGIGIEEAMLEADSGVSIKKLIGFATYQKLGGLEFFASQTGTVGGNFFITPALKDKVVQIMIMTKDGAKKTKYSNEVDREDIILSIVLKLKSISA